MINALKIAFLVSNEHYSIYFPRDLFTFSPSKRVVRRKYGLKKPWIKIILITRQSLRIPYSQLIQKTTTSLPKISASRNNNRARVPPSSSSSIVAFKIVTGGISKNFERTSKWTTRAVDQNELEKKRGREGKKQ